MYDVDPAIHKFVKESIDSDLADLIAPSTKFKDLKHIKIFENKERVKISYSQKYAYTSFLIQTIMILHNLEKPSNDLKKLMRILQTYDSQNIFFVLNGIEDKSDE